MSINTPRYLVNSFSDMISLLIFNSILIFAFLRELLNSTALDFETLRDSLLAVNQSEILFNSVLYKLFQLLLDLLQNNVLVASANK